MKKYNPIFLTIAMAAVLSLSGCKNKDTIDLTGIHESNTETAPISETMAQETASAPENIEIKVEPTESKTVEALTVRSQIATFKEGSVSIEYPILSNLKDKNTENSINDLIKEKATQIVSAYELDPTKDSLDISCEVVSLDRNKAVLKFNGGYTPENAAYPTDICYTLTVNLSKGTIQRLSDYVDPYTMAGYVLSDDLVITKSIDNDAVKEYLDTVDINTLWDTLKACDFSDDQSNFPSAFSYEIQGKIYMILPLPNVLGDYFIAEFNADSK